jgi:Carbonic anhydrases/acetyltransferases, isoleucine patch superfamily
VPIYALGEYEPEIHETAFVHPDAVVIGRVSIGAEASVWPCAVLRGDHGRIEVGARTSVQDGTVVHCTHEWPTLIGADCVVGHNAHLEGCVVGDGCLIGSGSITLNRVTVGAGAIVAAAAWCRRASRCPRPRWWPACPRRSRGPGCRPATPTESVRTYVESGRVHRAGLRRLEPFSRP